MFPLKVVGVVLGANIYTINQCPWILRHGHKK
jgi:hypothetical protein